MTPRVLITGADGFVGRHLAAYLVQEAGAGVLGLDMRPPREGGPWKACAFEVCDILDGRALFELVKGFRPHYVFHLAAQSSVRRSWEDPELTFRIALHGQANLIEALRVAGVEARVHVACSSEEYGKVSEDELPIRETHPLRPSSPYALSKVMQEYHAVFCHQAYGMETVITRAFNMIGPGQSAEFVASDFARQIAEAEAGMREPVIRVGNLEARRDFSDVRDLVGAYWELLRKGVPGEAYNVCSGEDHPVSELLDTLLSLSGTPIEVVVDPQKYRVADIPVLRGDNARMREVTGWRPRLSLEQTLSDVLDWWRAEVGGRQRR
ncbi:MAG: GDP-mannose 4,6-dehydratase [Actinobacteria bacterium]|nr:GDP-mannose 4,6-dehydratase [Actinomycetota bacterium]